MLNNYWLVFNFVYFGQVWHQTHHRLYGGEERRIVRYPRNSHVRWTQSKCGVFTVPS